MKRRLLKFLLKNLLNKPCPEQISRSGKKGEAVNCFSVKLKFDGELKLIVRKTDEKHFEGLWFDGNKFEPKACVSYEAVKLSQIEITHYYGLYTIKYFGINDYILNGFTGYERLKAKLNLNKEKMAQYLFNKKIFASIQRIELLRTLINHHIESNGKEIGTLQTMTNLYTNRWYFHPQKNHQKNQVKLFLNSFYESGELEKVQCGDFIVKGKAITTLSKYEENERRHKENRKMQILIAALTTALVVVGTFQAIATFYSKS